MQNLIIILHQGLELCQSCPGNSKYTSPFPNFSAVFFWGFSKEIQSPLKMNINILCHICGLKICPSHEKFCDAKISLKCSVCDKSFNKFHALQRHMYNHKPKVFECSQCHKSFSRHYNLIHHEKVHANVSKDWKCSICNASFGQKFNLTKHAKIHEEKLYNCSKCSKPFHCKSNQMRHSKVCSTKQDN